MHNTILALIINLSLQPAPSSRIQFPKATLNASSGYILYIYRHPQINCYFLIDNNSHKIILAEFNANHDSGESWLDIDEDEIQQHFNLPSKVQIEKEISGLPISIQEISMIQKSKINTIIKINDSKLKIYNKYQGFIFLKFVK